MTSLSDLFPPATDDRSPAARPAPGHRLGSLFDDGAGSSGSGSGAGSSGSSGSSGDPVVVGELNMLGLTPRLRTSGSAVATPEQDAETLRAVVGGRTSATEMLAASGAVYDVPPTRVRRVRGARDWITIAISVLAVVAVVVAAVLAVRVISSRSPAADAMATLEQSEAVLVDQIQAINGRIAALERSVETSVERAEGLAAPLAAMNGYADEAARVALDTARVDHIAALVEFELPSDVPAYRRANLDTDSLATVGTAIDDVQVRTASLAAAVDVVGDARASLVGLDAAFDQQVAAFVATVPAFAGTVIEAAPDAEDSFRVAVTEAAAAVAAADPFVPAGIATWTAYIDAVEALKTDQLRAEEEIRRQEELDNQPPPGGGWVPGPGDGGGGGGGGGGGPAPVDPVPPVDPEPDPEPEPDPDPEPPPVEPAPPGGSAR